MASMPRSPTIVASVHQFRPDVAVLDIDLPGLDGLSAAATLHTEAPDCRVLILTALAVPRSLPTALAVHVPGSCPRTRRRPT